MTTIFISKMEGLPPTSNIRMIDIWLVLCQMVPFAEVVLLTAIEYRRQDNRTEEGRTEVVDGDLEEEKAELSDDKTCKSCWVPNLKTLGNILVVHI